MRNEDRTRTAAARGPWRAARPFPLADFALCVCLSEILLAASPSATLAARRPNVLIIVGDDHQYEALGAYGSLIARTPHLDRLTAGGIRFDRAFCNAPICTPSRQSFLTGRYPHTTGVTLLTQALGEEQVTLAERLKSAGYRTGAFGKTHFNSNLAHGFEVLRHESVWQAQDAKAPRRPLPDGVEIYPAWRPFADPARVWLNSFYRPAGRYDDEMPGTWFAREAIAFMKAHRHEPFFVQIGFFEPHSPYTFPVEFRNRYAPGDMPVPLPGPEDAGQVPRIFADLTHEEKQGIIASYYTSVAYLDLNVGRVLDALEEFGLDRDTLVIYLGDNGYHLGHHGRFEKHTLYERNVRIPLVLRFPGRIAAAGATRALVELVDLVPTVLDYLGIAPAAETGGLTELHGLSLRPLIDGRTPRLRGAVFSEYQHTEQAMIRTERYKLIYQTRKAAVDWYEPVVHPPGGTVTLFDLDADPEEFHNTAAEPTQAGVVADLLDQLADWYRHIPPMRERPPAGLPPRDLLDWAVAPRNPIAPAGQTKTRPSPGPQK